MIANICVKHPNDVAIVISVSMVLSEWKAIAAVLSKGTGSACWDFSNLINGAVEKIEAQLTVNVEQGSLR